MIFTTRFAPSPTGPLHLGHAYSAMLAHDAARAQNGRFLVRLEDIDQSRARAEWEAAIYDDLKWLGLTWDHQVLRQSDNLPAYRTAITRLWRQGLVYPCTCRRRDIAAAVSAPQEGADPSIGPDGLIYPGTCRPAHPIPQQGPPPTDAALRLDLAACLPFLPSHITFTEQGSGPAGEYGEIAFPTAALIDTVGDIVIARRDMGTSYHLSVVVDDAAQGITQVVRGCDLFDATPLHRVLQHLLELPAPEYNHHRLIRDDTGRRLAKRDDARSIATYRAEGQTPGDIRHRVGLADKAS